MNGSKRVYFLVILVSFFLTSLCTSADEDAKVRFKSEISPSVLSDNEALNSARELQGALVDVVSRVLPSVVDIRIEKKLLRKKGNVYDFFRFFDKSPLDRDNEEPNDSLTSIGSGFVISEDGYVITNAHVVDGADNITVVLDGEEYKAKLVGSDSISDIAVISLEGVKSPLQYLKLENTSFEVGDLVIAVGNPFGLSGTFTFGVVSAKGRIAPEVDRNAIFKHFIQTDASINRGNSGGPLINIRGEVIGINTAIYASNFGGSVGIGFAIPVRIASPVVSDLLSKGNVERGYIGVSIKDLDDSLSEFFKREEGVIILWVEEGGPAYSAGLYRGDIIIKVGDKGIKDTTDLISTISSFAPKTKLIITVLREEKELKLPVVLAKRPTDPLISMQNKEKPREKSLDNKKKENIYKEEWLGLVFEDIRGEKGVGIREVLESSPAHKASNRIRKGDILESINSYSISNLSSLRNFIRKLQNKSSFMLWLKRGETRFYSIIKKSR